VGVEHIWNREQKFLRGNASYSVVTMGKLDDAQRSNQGSKTLHLFNAAVGDCTIQRPIINWEGCGRKRSWPDLRQSAGICLEGSVNVTNWMFQPRALAEAGPTLHIGS
jgi:hypothetical protein